MDFWQLFSILLSFLTGYLGQKLWKYAKLCTQYENQIIWLKGRISWHFCDSKITEYSNLIKPLSENVYNDILSAREVFSTTLQLSGRNPKFLREVLEQLIQVLNKSHSKIQSIIESMNQENKEELLFQITCQKYNIDRGIRDMLINIPETIKF